MRKRKGMCVVWPVYFDANESRKLRRVPRDLAIPGPSLEELCAAVEKLGLKYEVVTEAAHPSRHWAKTGYLIVEKTGPKEELLRRIARELKNVRSSKRKKLK